MIVYARGTPFEKLQFASGDGSPQRIHFRKVSLEDMSRINQVNPQNPSPLRIGQVAQLLGISTKTIRHYHKLGLLPEAARSEKGYRLYHAADLYRLKRILQLKAVGFSLVDIGEIIQAENPDTALSERLAALEAELTAQSQELNAKLGRVQTLLAESATLAYVERPAGDSARLQALLAGAAPNYAAAVPAEAQRIDAEVLARLEAFDWGPEARLYWAEVARASSGEASYLATLSEHLQRAGQLSVDDPRLAEMASEIVGKIAGEIPRLSKAPEMDPPVQAAFQQVLSDSIAELLNPSQLQLLSLIHKHLYPAE